MAILTDAGDHRAGHRRATEHVDSAGVTRCQPGASKRPLTCLNEANVQVAASSHGARLAVFETDMIEYLSQEGSIHVRLRKLHVPSPNAAFA